MTTQPLFTLTALPIFTPVLLYGYNKCSPIAPQKKLVYLSITAKKP
jgi:hypothetical protein